VSESVASALSAGAGRFLDYVWPSPFQFSGQNINTACHARNGSDETFTTGNRGLIGGGSNVISALVLGVPCVNCICGVGVGTQQGWYPPFPIMLRTSRSLITPLTDDMFCYRLVACMAGNGVAAAAGSDFGFQVTQIPTPASSSRIVADAAQGFGLRIQDTNTVQFLTRGANGLITVNLTVAPFDTTQWHRYEFRLTSASAVADAFLELRIDGNLIAMDPLNSSWGVGTNLPPVPLNGTLAGFMSSIVSAANNVNALFVTSVNMIAAPSILMTL
jgi:hypothetical protein